MAYRVVSSEGVALDQRFGGTDSERAAAVDAAEHAARETGVAQAVRLGTETVHVAEPRR